MADTVDEATRSRMMASIRGKNTGPEIALRRILWSAGVRGYRLHRRDIKGTPDVAWVGKRVAVFVDGAFWHGHPSAFTTGKSGDYWDMKIERNQRRDAEVNQALLDDGWSVVRVWDFEVENRPADVLRLVTNVLTEGRTITDNADVRSLSPEGVRESGR